MDSQPKADRLALTALGMTVDLGFDARKALADLQICTVSAWRRRSQDSRADSVARGEARRPALAIVSFTAEPDDNKDALTEIVETMAPGFLDMPGPRSRPSRASIRFRLPPATPSATA